MPFYANNTHILCGFTGGAFEGKLLMQDEGENESVDISFFFWDKVTLEQFQFFKTLEVVFIESE